MFMTVSEATVGNSRCDLSKNGYLGQLRWSVYYQSVPYRSFSHALGLAYVDSRIVNLGGSATKDAMQTLIVKCADYR